MNSELPSGSGGGLAGIASTLPISGRAITEALARLRWRGNGRGGGVALVGCFPHRRDHFALSIALRVRQLRAEVEREFIAPYFDIRDAEFQPEAGDYRQFPGLVERPPIVVRYFVRARPDALADFMARNGFTDASEAEEAFVAQCAARLNRARYTEPLRRRAFALSHGRDMMILKASGYADDVARYYRLDEMAAFVWLGCQTFATLTHPGGANPFPGRDEAVALCGGFANHSALATYARQQGYLPLFHADGELAAMLFDFTIRANAYPLDLALEAMLPTPAGALERLPPLRRDLYRALQQTHAPAAWEGPVFLAAARHVHRERAWQLIAAVDPAATHAHAFALQEGVLWNGERYGIGAVASERGAVEAAFAAIAAENNVVCPVPDQVWAVRSAPEAAAPARDYPGDGGAYIFTVAQGEGDAPPTLTCADKFGRVVATDQAQAHRDPPGAAPVIVSFPPNLLPSCQRESLSVESALSEDQIEAIYAGVHEAMRGWSFAALTAWLDAITERAAGDALTRAAAVQVLTRLYDRRYNTGVKKRSAVQALLRQALYRLFDATAADADAADTAEAPPADPDRRLTWVTLATGGVPAPTGGVLYIDAADLPLEGPDMAARVVIRAHRAGWRRLVVFGCKGDRFIGSGLGDSAGLRLDLYGTAGDYLAAGLDGAEVHLHGSAQDLAGHLMTRGALVIHGDVGQAFLYSATGGEAYVLGQAGARAFANAGSAVCAVVGGRFIDLPGATGDPDSRRAALERYAALFGAAHDAAAQSAEALA